ncbi:DUF305 domain-containing protein [Micromonospora sp. PLK6-60]|uniref:DUF305 domain-containing protein n=1 Tax=Micromonospora sp. PLK6-60 TaxID=2873383 RepID=UPI001CA613DD|nr:DUF305 domain-containing protein [Micromonospora sp. PLK6-60]MBY8872953.1 DUF305 domain-containing protein [Micromonospora sp. PLK6-60]
MLIELVVLAVVAAGVAAVVWWPDGQPSPAAKPEPTETLALPRPPEVTAPVLLPGAPGEPAKTLAANELTPAPRRPHNNADTRFVTMMIPHHEQALVMAKLVADRGQNPQLKIMADRIVAAQEPEIKTMETWLADRGLDRNSGGRHQHEMRGMQSPEALDRLAAARGAEFDRMFVSMMIEHHQGAIDMAGEALALGVDVIINEMAGGVIAEQTAEINRMREVLGAK